MDVKMDRGITPGKVIDPVTINGYDGFSGTHDNLLWIPDNHMATYTLHNKIIVENLKTRHQTILTESEVRLSTLARSPDGKYLAAGEGEANRDGKSLIYLYDAPMNSLLIKIAFYEKGI